MTKSMAGGVNASMSVHDLQLMHPGVPDLYLYKQPAPSPDGWQECFERLAGLDQLKDDWDGLGAAAPDFALIEGANEFARLMRDRGTQPPSRVLPGVTGTVLIEWQTPETYFEVEVTGPNKGEVTEVTEGAAARYYQIDWGTPLVTTSSGSIPWQASPPDQFDWAMRWTTSTARF